MSPPAEVRTVRVAADLAEAKASWMARFGWVLEGREDRLHTGDLLVERAIPHRHVASADITHVAVLRFRRGPVPARLAVVEAEFWHPTLVPGWAFTTLAVARWSALALAILALQWVVLLTTVDFGTDPAVRLGLRAFVAPIGGAWVLAVTTLAVGTRLVRRLERDPALREARLRDRQEHALREAAVLLRAAPGGRPRP